MRVLITSSQEDENIAAPLIAALETLGHVCHQLRDDPHPSQLLFEFLAASPWRGGAKRWLTRCKKRATERLVAATSMFRPEAIIVLQGTYFLREGIHAIRTQKAIPVINWLVHDPIFPEFFDPFRIISLTEYSSIFLADPLWHPSIAYICERHVEHLPLAGNSFMYRALAVPKTIDVLLVADPFPLHRAGLNGLVALRVLNTLGREGFHVHVAVTRPAALRRTLGQFPAVSICRRSLGDAALNDLYNQSKIVLSLIPLDYKTGLSANVFNTALSGAFQIMERKYLLDQLMPQQPSFRSLAELPGLLRDYLVDTASRESMAEKMKQVVESKHTYAVRVGELLSKINS